MNINNPRLCFHFAASPNDAFYSQIAMFRLSLDALGDFYEKSTIIITFGEKQKQPIPNRWQNYLSKNVLTNWAKPQQFQQWHYHAQLDARWIVDHCDYDFIFFMDADTLFINRIDDLLINLMQHPAISGTIAHNHPPIFENDNPQKVWQDLADRFIQKKLEFNYRYTLIGIKPDPFSFCPFYINFGVIGMPSAIIALLATTYLNIRPKISDHIRNPFFAGQITLALAVAKLDLPVQALPMRYNFPNDSRADRLQINELHDARIIHYLRTANFDRHQIFTSPEDFHRFLKLTLVGSDKKLQDRVAFITKSEYPFR